ncbi:MAG TPA: DPP IV N-terminal domain-containing protein, partial [Calditrichia bacterium]|nr:DPP IV N-terminal domain-containing protein [Calditrichia bacterium]
MKKLALLLIASVTLLMCSSNQVREIRQYSIEQFYQNTNIRGGSFSPDETNLLITSNQTGIYNVFALPLDGTAPAQLTQSTGESNFAVSYLPNGDGFIYASDSGGDENDHLFWVNSEGNTTDLTPSEGAKSDFMQWSRDEKSMFFISNKRDPRFFDLYEMEMEGFGNPDAHRLVYQNDEGFDIGALSSNKRYLTLVKSITTSNNDLYLYDLQSRQLKHISPHDGDAQYNPQFFDLANENLYFLTNENDEYMYLASFNIAGGATEKVYGTNWDIWYAYTSYNEKYRIMGINEDAQTRIRITDLQTNQELVLPEIKGGSISSAGVSKSEKLMRLTVSTSSSPSNLYLYNMESKELTKLTNTLNPEIDPADLVEGEVIRYKSYDGLEIPAVYYRPLQAGVNSKVPGLVWVHGGPGGQSRLNYFALI